MAKRISYNEEAQQFDEQKVRISDNFVQAYKPRELRVEDDPFYKLGEGLKDLSKGLKMMHEAGQEDRDVEAQAAALEFSKQEQPYKDKVHADVAEFNKTGNLSGRTLEFYKYHARQQAVQFSRAYRLELDRQLIAAGNNPDTDLAAMQEQAYNTVVGAYPSSTTENIWFRSIQGDSVGKINATWEGEVSKAHTKKMFNENVEAWTEDQQDALLEWSEGGGEGDLVAALNVASGAFYESDSEAIQLQPDQMGDIQVAAITEFAKNNANMGDVDDVQELLTAVQSDSFKLNGLGKARKEELIQNLEQQLIQAEKVQDTRSTGNRSEVVNAANGAMYRYLYTGGEKGAPITEANRDEFITYLEQELQGYPPQIVEELKYKAFDDLKTQMTTNDNNAYTMSRRDVVAANEISARNLTEIRNRIANGASQEEINTFIGEIEGLTPEHTSDLINQSGLYLNTEKIATDFYRDSGKRILGETVAVAYLTQLDSQIADAEAMFGMNDGRYTAAVMRKIEFQSEANQIILEVVRDWSATSEGGVPMTGDFAAIAGLVDARLTARFAAEQTAQPVAETTKQQTDLQSQAKLQDKKENDDLSGAEQVRLDQLNESQAELDKAQGQLMGGLSEARGVATNNTGPIDAIGNWLFDSKSTEDNTLAGFLGPDRVGGGSYVPQRPHDNTDNYVNLTKKELGGLYLDVWSSTETEGYEDNKTYKESVERIQHDKAVFERTIRAQTPDEDGDIVALRQAGVSSITDESIGRSGLSLEEIQTGQLQYGDRTVEVDHDLIHPAFFPMVNSWDEYEATTDAQWGEIINAFSPNVKSLIERDAATSGRTPIEQVKAIQGVVLQSFFMRDLPGQNKN